MENKLHDNLLMRGFDGFNSATAVMPWRTPIVFASPAYITRFNSATAVMPWRTAGVLAKDKDKKPLQFGHGGDAVENVDENRLLRDRIRASIRPRR